MPYFEAPQKTPPEASKSGFFHVPVTQMGRCAGGLALLFLSMFFINGLVMTRTTSDAPWRQSVLPFFGIAMVGCGLASGALGWLAILRHSERSWLAWLGASYGVFMLFLLLGEFLIPH